MAIKNKVVIITGASSGIGQATAKLLASKGAKVVLGARREEKLKQLVNEIRQNGHDAIYQVTDVVKRKDNEELVKLAKETYGQVDVIFLNAGVMPLSPLSALKVDEWDQMIDVNLRGVLYGIAAILPSFIEQNGGQIITTSSVAGLNSDPTVGVYGATKWAIRDLMEVLRKESAQEGTNIRTTTLYPAAINTELLSHISDKDVQDGLQKGYDEHAITPDRIANVVAFAIDQPEDTSVNEFTIYPTKQVD